MARKVKTGPDTVWSYVHLNEPYSFNDQVEKKYSVSLIIPKKDKQVVNAINDAIRAAYEEDKEKFKLRNGNYIPFEALRTPLRDGDVDKADDPAYANAYYVNAKANEDRKPQIIDCHGRHLSAEEIYSGCKGEAIISFYAYNTSMSKGIACGLGNMLKRADGEPLGGGAGSAESDFAAELSNINIEIIG